jgi:hypothetical protein
MHASTRLRSLLLLALASASACGGAEAGISNPTPGPTPVVPDTTVLTRPARALDIAVSLDRARATTLLIDTIGGSITATAGDGTRYTLVIPRNALLVATRITLTPVSATAGHPVAGSGAGVAFEPEGLRLLQPAVLRIQPGGALQLTDQIAIGWHADGRDVHLEPLQLGTTDVAMDIWHFSGVSVGGIYVGDNVRIQTADWADYTPQEFEDRARQYLAQLVAEQRAAALRGEPVDPKLFEQFRAVYDKWYALVIKPMMARSAGDCVYAKANASKGVSWARSAALLGFDDLGNEVYSSFAASVNNCLDVERAHCLQPGDTTRAREVLGLARLAGLLGPADMPVDRVPDCPSGWNGDFTTVSPGFAPGTIERVTAHVVFTLDTSTGNVDRYKVGSGTVEWSFSGPLGTDCTAVGSMTVATTPTDGILLITRGNPTTYVGKGGTVFPTVLTVTCPTGVTKVPYNAAALWFMSDEIGIPLPVQSDTHIVGQRSSPSGSLTWDLTLMK